MLYLFIPEHHPAQNNFEISRLYSYYKKIVSDDIFQDMIWVICDYCGCLQLGELIPLDILYGSNHNNGVVGATWDRHHQEFAKFILKNNPKEIGASNRYLEIGGSHGYLASLILQEIPDAEYAMIEPNASNLDSRIKLVSGFAEDHLDLLANYPTIIHSHVLEHVYSARDFLDSISSAMYGSSEMYISFPNIQSFLETNGTNSLNFEHTYFLEPSQLKSVLEQLNFKVAEVYEFEKHSFFFKVVKKSGKGFVRPIVNIKEKVWYFDNMWNELEKFTSETRIRLSQDNVPTFLFGAHIFSQVLYLLGISKNVIGVLDNSSAKIGERLYGTPYKVFDPAEISSMSAVRVILKAGSYQDEIRAQLLSINSDVQILE